MRFKTSERRDKVHRSVPNTTANAVCYIHWHYGVVGVTVTLALLKHRSVLLQWAPSSLLQQQEEVLEEYGASFGCAHCVYFPVTL